MLPRILGQVALALATLLFALPGHANAILDAAGVKAAIATEKKAFDVFLSVPMASFASDAQYKAFRANAMKVVRALRTKCRLTVFCALENIKSIKQFDLCGNSAFRGATWRVYFSGQSGVRKLSVFTG